MSEQDIVIARYKKALQRISDLARDRNAMTSNLDHDHDYALISEKALRGEDD